MENDFHDIRRYRQDSESSPTIRVRDSMHMDRKDIQAVILVSDRYVTTDIDLLAWTNCLEAYALLDEFKGHDLRTELTSSTLSQTDRWNRFLKEMLRSVSFDGFVNSLYKVGLTKYAEDLMSTRYGDVLLRIGRADMPHASFIQKFYCNLKRNIDNGNLNNCRTFLTDKIQNAKSTIEQSNDVDTRQYYAERLVAYYILILPHYSGYDRRKSLLDEMKLFFQRVNEGGNHDNNEATVSTIDSTSADIVYNSKMATTTAIAGNFDEAQRYVLEAEYLGSQYKSCLARTLAIHDHQYIFRREYMRTQKTEYLSRVMLIGDRGLRMLMEEADDVRNQWNRLLMLYEVLSLLQITSDFKVKIVTLSSKTIEQAKEVLKEVRGSFDGIETRREMIYSICMARINEDVDLEQAMTYTKKAVALSCSDISYLPREEQNLREYMQRLKSKQLKKELFQWIFQLPVYVYVSVFICFQGIFLMLYINLGIV